MKAQLLTLGLITATVATVAAWPGIEATATQGSPSGTVVDPLTRIPAEQRARIEVVFVLDTTGSMGGLIEAAKEKIWSIASTMAAAQPAPEIHMGLVGYRDRGDDYVTRIVDLSSDLDSMNAILMDFQAGGGGDGPEAVNKALYDAVHAVSWSQDPDTYRVVFLVGDAPAHMDYHDEVKYPEIIAAAQARGIVINTIQCGNAGGTTPQWQHIAQLGSGRYFRVDQAGSAIALATPYDKKLADLSAELDRTRLYYGKPGEQAQMARKLEAGDKLHAASSPAALARRASFNASASGSRNFLGEGELVDAVVNGRVDLETLPEAELPAALQPLSLDERKAQIEEMAAQRADLTRQVEALSRKREAFLEDQVAASGDADASLDHKIYEAVREQAKEKGIEYADGPAY